MAVVRIEKTKDYTVMPDEVPIRQRPLIISEFAPVGARRKTMKKLFISCPMAGRTEKNIRKSMEKMHRIAEVIFDEELEVMESYISDHAPKTKHDRIWYLGESIKMMADADYFIGIEGYKFDGCALERSIAERYGIKGHIVPLGFIADDVAKDVCVPREW